MEEKDTNQAPNPSQTTNNFTNIGPNYGIIAGSVHMGDFKAKATEEQPAGPVETAVWKSSVVELVSKGLTKEALAEILKTKPSEDITHQVALLSGRLSQVEIGRIAGIIDEDKETIELARIRDGILTLVSRI